MLSEIWNHFPCICVYKKSNSTIWKLYYILLSDRSYILIDIVVTKSALYIHGLGGLVYQRPVVIKLLTKIISRPPWVI